VVRIAAGRKTTKHSNDLSITGVTWKALYGKGVFWSMLKPIAINASCIGILLAGTMFIAAQTPYPPKFPGDPARSESEARALGYMRTVIRAERQYQKKNDGKFAASLDQLVHTGSFTKRMTATDRGDYKVSFHSRKGKDKDQGGYELTLIPQQLDAEHRSFYANEDGVIYADEEKTASENSPKVK
jgi:hypothetical protein